MKKQIILSVLFVCSFILSQAQNRISSQPILSGKYSMELQISSVDSIQKVVLMGSLPHYYKIALQVTVTELNGKVHQIRVQKYSTKGNVELFTTSSPIQKVAIQSFSLDYSEFGEPYLVSWNQDLNQLQVTRGGRDYTYGNLFQIEDHLVNMEKTHDLAREK